MTLTVATWNVNSIKARLPNILDWLREARPDVVLMQELKCEEPAFPELEIGDLGYNVAVNGQKSWNGVAILSKRPLEDVERGLPGDDNDGQARYIEATVGDLRVASLYLPNGNPADSEKYPYKLAWMDRLRDRAKALLETEQPFLLGGDYNVIPEPEDVYDPAGWETDALYRPETRRRFRAVLHLGLTEAYRALHPEPGAFTYWDYKGRAWEADRGLRIDHFLLSPQAADRLIDCRIDKSPRARPKASDHTPVICELTD
jgi:exodeoxyribonuclease-3